MAGDIRQVVEWIYGTRSDQESLYHLISFVTEVGTKPVADYLLFGHDGHGINPYTMHYYLVRGPLALFVQEGWGGAYGDSVAEVQAVTERFRQAEALVHAVDAAQQRGAFKPDERLVVIARGFSRSIWRRLHGLAVDQNALFASPDWHEERDVLAAVTGMLSDA